MGETLSFERSTAIPAADEPGLAEGSQVKKSLNRSLVALFKVRVVLLLLFAPVAGAFLAAGGWPTIAFTC